MKFGLIRHGENKTTQGQLWHIFSVEIWCIPGWLSPSYRWKCALISKVNFALFSSHSEIWRDFSRWHIETGMLTLWLVTVAELAKWQLPRVAELGRTNFALFAVRHIYYHQGRNNMSEIYNKMTSKYYYIYLKSQKYGGAILGSIIRSKNCSSTHNRPPSACNHNDLVVRGFMWWGFLTTYVILYFTTKNLANSSPLVCNFLPHFINLVWMCVSFVLKTTQISRLMVQKSDSHATWGQVLPEPLWQLLAIATLAEPTGETADFCQQHYLWLGRVRYIRSDSASLWKAL